MKVLAYGKSPAELGKVLTVLGHEVRLASTDAQARDAVRASIPDVVLTEFDPPLEPMLDFVRFVRTHAATRKVYVLAGGLSNPEHVWAAYDAGCDGEYRRPATEQDLRARLRPARRLLGLPDEAPPKAAPAASPPPAAPAVSLGAGNDGVELVLKSETWRKVTEQLSATAAQFLTLTVNHGEESANQIAPAHSVKIVLANAALQLELSVLVGIDGASASALALHMFGEDSPELGSDLISELSNVFMGSLKTSFGREALAFTGSLPQPLEAGVFDRAIANNKLQEAFVLSAESARVRVRVALASRKNAVLGVALLREGMVVAKDVVSPTGVMLVTAGTRLSETMSERLRRLLNPKQLVEVAPGDA